MSKSDDVVLIHVSDLHIGSCRFAFDYLKRTHTMLLEILRVVTSHSAAIKIVVIAGDLFDTKSLKEPERNLGIWFLTQLIDAGVEIVLINGNHDYYSESVTMLHGLVHLQKLSRGLLHVVVSDPAVINLKAAGISFLCVPCQQDLTTKALRNILTGLRKKAKYETCYGVVHEAISGSMTDTKHVMKTRCSLDPLDGIQGILCGDIHKQQRLAPGVWYSGSPYQTNYRDAPDKGILLWTPGQIDPVPVMLDAVPQLVRVKSEAELRKYENTNHSVKYTGPRVTIDAPNVVSNFNLDLIEATTALVAETTERVRHSVLEGLKTFLAKEGLNEKEVKRGYRIAKAEAHR